MASFVSHAVASKGGNRQKGERNANFDYTFFAASWPTYLPAVLSYDICSQPQPGGCQLRPKGSPESEIEDNEDVPELEALVEDSNTETYTSHKGTNLRWKEGGIGSPWGAAQPESGSGGGGAPRHITSDEWKVFGVPGCAVQAGAKAGATACSRRVMSGSTLNSGRWAAGVGVCGLKLREVGNGGWGMRMARCFGVHRVLRSREGGSSATPLKQLQKAKDDDDKQGHGMK
ncbi:hypothetical protein C8R43DRAFT_963668 [Mycena crocata]|nr:hypothetical protein C8R43DRAFT_963668 [Mycena crocata]